jgi:hypothetical protein
MALPTSHVSVPSKALEGLGEAAELGGVSVLDEALASGSELELVSELQSESELELVLAFRRRTTPTRSSYRKDNQRRR